MRWNVSSWLKFDTDIFTLAWNRIAIAGPNYTRRWQHETEWNIPFRSGPSSSPEPSSVPDSCAKPKTPPKVQGFWHGNRFRWLERNPLHAPREISGKCLLWDGLVVDGFVLVKLGRVKCQLFGNNFFMTVSYSEIIWFVLNQPSNFKTHHQNTFKFQRALGMTHRVTVQPQSPVLGFWVLWCLFDGLTCVTVNGLDANARRTRHSAPTCRDPEQPTFPPTNVVLYVCGARIYVWQYEKRRAPNQVILKP